MKHDRLTVARGDVLDYSSVESAVRGQDAVLCALGHKRFVIPSTILSRGTAHIVAAMEACRVRRLVCMTSLGIGDSWGRMGLLYGLFLEPLLLHFYFQDKEKQEKLIRESSLDWVIVRPGALTNGPRRGAYRHGAGVGHWLWTVRISRADVADFMLNQLGTTLYLRSAPGVSR